MVSNNTYLKVRVKKTINFAAYILTFLLFIISANSHAKGVALGATRLIYPRLAKQASINVYNSSPDSRYLIQSWIENSNGEKTSDFIITPPLFVSKAKSENALRIIYVGKPLPTDRESLFWLNSKAIPELDSDNIAGKNVLQLAVVSRIKIFVRPEHLGTSEENASDKIRFKHHGNFLDIRNPTPYYLTLVKLTVGGKVLPNTMIPPLHTTRVNCPDGVSGPVMFRTINDYGAMTPVQKGLEE